MTISVEYFKIVFGLFSAVQAEPLPPFSSFPEKAENRKPFVGAGIELRASNSIDVRANQ